MIRLAVRVRREQAELVLAELLELAPGGVEESELDGELIEYAVYGAPGELPELPELEAAAGEALVEISTSETADDWHERWKRFHRPILLDAPGASAERVRRVPALHVRPPWEADSAGRRGAVEEIVIDPGRAFGTGAHATTRMCLELLLELASEQRSPGALLDVGTGSGVLAIAAARLGFEPVLALDHERESVEATRENALVNNVAIEARRFDLRAEPLPWLGRSDAPAGPIVVLANLLLPLLLELARTVASPPAQLLASGLLVEQVDEVVEAFGERLGLHERRRVRSGEWAAVWLLAPSLRPYAGPS
ncbi:MAG TPA: 50S ribosomal protein L11 methyltransferase [Solirubrobacteraceae bacterium]|nr:50S ribosomal protein L11 methyltransferase [Solirubrobacteraceae bacterium]